MARSTTAGTFAGPSRELLRKLSQKFDGLLLVSPQDTPECCYVLKKKHQRQQIQPHSDKSFNLGGSPIVYFQPLPLACRLQACQSYFRLSICNLSALLNNCFHQLSFTFGLSFVLCSCGILLFTQETFKLFKFLSRIVLPTSWRARLHVVKTSNVHAVPVLNCCDCDNSGAALGQSTLDC